MFKVVAFAPRHVEAMFGLSSCENDGLRQQPLNPDFPNVRERYGKVVGVIIQDRVRRKTFEFPKLAQHSYYTWQGWNQITPAELGVKDPGYDESLASRKQEGRMIKTLPNLDGTHDFFFHGGSRLNRAISSGSLGCPSVRMRVMRLMEGCRAVSERLHAALGLYIKAEKSTAITLPAATDGEPKLRAFRQ